MHPSSGVLKTVSATSGVRHGNGTVSSFLRGLKKKIRMHATTVKKDAKVLHYINETKRQAAKYLT